MTTEDKIAYIRLRGEVNEVDEQGNYVDSDDLLSSFITDAEDAIMNRAYPYGYSEETTFPAKYDVLSCKIAIYLLNKRGADGQLSHSENGISRSYGGSDIPSDLLQTVIPYCGVGGSAT